jgi:hypothetical protein
MAKAGRREVLRILKQQSVKKCTRRLTGLLTETGSVRVPPCQQSLGMLLEPNSHF